MYYSRLAEFLKKDKIDDVAVLLTEIYQREPQYFYSRVITEGEFPSPVKYDFDENVCIVRSFEKAIPVAKEILAAGGADGRHFEETCSNILNILSVIHKNFVSNAKRLAQCKFFKLPRGLPNTDNISPYSGYASSIRK